MNHLSLNFFWFKHLCKDPQISWQLLKVALLEPLTMHMVRLKVHCVLVSTRDFISTAQWWRHKSSKLTWKLLQLVSQEGFLNLSYFAVRILIFYSCRCIPMTKVLHENQTMDVQGCSKLCIWQKSGDHYHSKKKALVLKPFKSCLLAT